LQKPIHGLTEDDAIYPKAPLCHYTHTKMLAEKVRTSTPSYLIESVSSPIVTSQMQFVLAANGKAGLLTGVLRPNAIYGPRDVRTHYFLNLHFNTHALMHMPIDSCSRT
jgi:hypothetical protein